MAEFHQKLIKILFITFIFIGAGCHDTRTGPYPESRKLLEGTWNWVQTSGGFMGNTTKPEDSGYVLKRIFTGDSEFMVYRNDTLLYSGTYTLKAPTDQDQDYLINYNVQQQNDNYQTSSLTAQYISFISADSLVLMDNCYDCYISIWSR